MKWIPQKRLASVLGLSFTAGRMSAFAASRIPAGAGGRKAFTAACSLDPLAGEAGPVGREIRDQLAAAGIRDRSCVVAIPPEWVMCQQTKVPELSAEDLAGFLQMEAEKGFSSDPALLQITRSTCRASGIVHVTQLAVRRDQIERLVAVLNAAGLEPVSLTLGLAALPGAVPSGEDGRITIAVEPAEIGLLVAAGGGIASARTCEANDGAVARELRISFEQVPSELRAGVRRLALCGDENRVRPLAESLADWAVVAGLTIEWQAVTEHPLGEQIAAGVAVAWLETGASHGEFLPVRPGRLAGVLAKFNSRRLGLAGLAAVCALALTLGAFGWQEYRRWRLRSEWAGMQAQVTDLTAMQTLIRDYRPWYDTTFHSLGILRSVTGSFPDNGSVTAKSFSIHGASSVSVTGTARDNAALLLALDQLRKTREIQNLKVEQIRGKAPLQFTLTFRWAAPSGS